MQTCKGFGPLLKSIYFFAHRRFSFFPSNLAVEQIGDLDKVGNEPYGPGQLFIHRHFGYRGIVMAAWKGKLFDRSTIINGQDSKNSAPSEIQMYQVLTDDRDLKYSGSVLKSGITFLPEGNDTISTIYIISGMDYVFHQDMIPFRSGYLNPISNDYVKDFFIHDGDRQYLPTENLFKWVDKRKENLEVTTVHRETTDGICTTTIPFFMGRRPIDNKLNEFTRYWRYLIRMENKTSDVMQLRERFWKVFSVSGSLESVKGKGVVGMQPLLSPVSPIFQYHSHVQVHVPWAHMWGSFRFEKQFSGASLDVKIPAFPLCDKAHFTHERDGRPPTSTDASSWTSTNNTTSSSTNHNPQE